MGTVELKANEWKDFAANHEYAVIDCSGDNCVACLMLEPVYNAVADTLPAYVQPSEPSLEDAYLYLISREAVQ